MAKRKAPTTVSGPDLFSASEPKKLFLLDGMALIYRAHFGMIRSPRFTSGEVPTSGVFGVANTVLDLIKRQKPTHMAIAFDTSDPTFRHEMFTEYKAQRCATGRSCDSNSVSGSSDEGAQHYGDTHARF